MADNAFTRFGNRLFDPGVISEENVQRNQAMADALLGQASNPRPIQHPLQGVAMLANALNAQAFRQKGIRGQEALGAQKAKQLGNLLGSFDPSQQEFVRNLPEGVRNDVLGDVAKQRLLKTGQTGDPFTLSGGQTRFDAQGNPIASLPASETDNLDAREIKIRDFMDSFDMPRPDAIKFVDNKKRVVRDDFGRAAIIDDVAGTAEEISIGPAAGTVPEPVEIEPGQTLWQQAPRATGPVNTTAAALSVPSSTVGGPISESVNPIQQFAVAQNTLIRALSINPRFPVAEMERIRDEIKIEPGFFTGTDLLRSRMRGIDQQLDIRINQEERAAADTTLPEETRKNAARAAKDLKSFRETMGVPQNTIPKPEGIDQDLWDSQTEEWQREFINAGSN